MGRIRGHYEWDDDELTPGSRAGGGLHQNLFDRDGKLRGNARFVPADEDDDHAATPANPTIVTESVFITIEERRRTQAQEDRDRLVGLAVEAMLNWAYARAKPHVQGWWRGTARPAIDDRRRSLAERRSARRARKIKAASGRGGRGDDGVGDHEAVAPASHPPMMSLPEARARCVAALAARVYSDEQLQLVESAIILDSVRTQPSELVRDVGEPLRTNVIERIANDPRLLTEENLAQLASLLDRTLPSIEGKPSAAPK